MGVERDQNVARLDVTMHDRQLVHVREPQGKLFAPHKALGSIDSTTLVVDERI